MSATCYPSGSFRHRVSPPSLALRISSTLRVIVFRNCLIHGSRPSPTRSPGVSSRAPSCGARLRRCLPRRDRPKQRTEALSQ